MLCDEWFPTFSFPNTPYSELFYHFAPGLSVLNNLPHEFMILLLPFCLRFIRTILFFKQSNSFLFQTFNHFCVTLQCDVCLVSALHFSFDVDDRNWNRTGPIYEKQWMDPEDGAAVYSETLIGICQTVRLHISGDSNLHYSQHWEPQICPWFFFFSKNAYYANFVTFWCDKQMPIFVWWIFNKIK